MRRAWLSLLVLASCAAPASWPPSRPAPAAQEAGCPLGGCEAAAPAVAAAAPPLDLAVECPDAPSVGRCTKAALAAWAGAQGDAMEVVRAAFVRACSFGGLEACHFAGRMTLAGKGGARDARAGESALERACDGGWVASCEVLVAHFQAKGNPGPTAEKVAAHNDEDRDEPSAQKVRRFSLVAGCYRAVGTDCFRAGLGFDRGGDGFPRDPARGVAMYSRGCDQGDLPSCNNLANAYYYGEGVPADSSRAAELYQRVCERGHAIGCANVGFLAEWGDGVPRDVPRAEKLYVAACAQGSAYACIHAAMLEAYKKGAPREPAAALAQWRRACVSGEAKACGFAGVMLEDGKGGTRDEEAAMGLVRRGCAGSDPHSCAWLREKGLFSK